jgi:hypothetical protein
LSIFSRFSKQRRSSAGKHSPSTPQQPAAAAAGAPSTRAQATTTIDTHRHGDCPVKHRSPAAAARCRNS